MADAFSAPFDGSDERIRVLGQRARAGCDALLAGTSVGRVDRLRLRAVVRRAIGREARLLREGGPRPPA